ncbi:MAG: tetratricopeptide repeat protein [Spirochaetales bacterium]|nr:tetratricopeptide repeat protein [Spirochaetales bacterium]
MILLVVSSVLFTACETCEFVIDDEMTPTHYFNRAQNASNRGCYNIAILYYQEFLKNYPNNIEKGAWAEYQIAFLNHKIGNDELALELLNTLLNRYQSDTSGELPEAPKTLALKVKANIEKKMQQ